MKYLLLFLLISCAVVDENTHKTTTEHPKEKYLNLLVIGDSGTGGRDQYRVGKTMEKVCKSEDCKAALMLGDVVYNNGLKSINHRKVKTHIKGPYKGIDIPFRMMLGNHDHRWGRRDNLILLGQIDSKFTMLGRYYLVPGLPKWVRIFAMDTHEMDRGQLRSIRKNMCGFKGLKIIAGHHQIFSSGKHNFNRKMYRKLMPIIKKCRIDLYLAGHDHNLEHLQRHDVNYVISGAAAKLRGRGDKSKYSKWFKSELGFLILGLREDKYRLRFYNVKGQIIYNKEVPNG